MTWASTRYAVVDFMKVKKKSRKRDSQRAFIKNVLYSV